MAVKITPQTPFQTDSLLPVESVYCQAPTYLFLKDQNEVQVNLRFFVSEAAVKPEKGERPASPIMLRNVDASLRIIDPKLVEQIVDKPGKKGPRQIIYEQVMAFFSGPLGGECKVELI